MERARAVFFDFGGTLFSYQTLAKASLVPFLAEAVDRLGSQASPGDAVRAYGVAAGESFRLFEPKPYYLHRDLFRDTFRRMALALECEPEDDFLDWLHERQRALFFEACELRPGCNEMLGALREEGLYLAIVSNIDDDYLLPMVEKLGLDLVLDAWTSSEEAGSCKPDGAIFDYCLQKAGVTASESVFVGDSPVHDISGARRAGMQTVLICEPGQGGRQGTGLSAPGTGDGGAVEADHVIEDLAELVPIVLRASG